ncbi:MAG: RHS repeat-associated core domain-containing protein [Leptothrix ochracea]|uniref:RHS repeat-associated core domain-containing protein n=1 Tax=Leptothrix ochracea TaxID=735331 RepID=UPI0034E27973
MDIRSTRSLLDPISKVRNALRLALFTFTLLVCGSVEAVSVSVTPGTTDGQVNVGPDGSVGYSIPIRVPPGTAGIEPKLVLAYNSRSGPSAFGFGWSVGGISSVQRGPRNIPEDGAVRGVYLDQQDALYLDGEKLVQVSVNADGSREFRTRIDNYSRIRAYDWNDRGPQRIVVNTRAGLKLSFGSASSSRVRQGPNGPILTWLCDRIEDSVGNYMTFAYVIEGLDHRLLEVSYTGNDQAKLQPYAKVAFEYSTISPYDIRYVLGARVSQKTLLTRIVSSYRGKVLREYKPTFEAADKFRPAQKLLSLTESGSDGLSYRPLQFLYSSAAGGWKAIEKTLPDDVVNVTGKQNFEFANIQGKNGLELFYRFTAAGQSVSGAFEYETSAHPVTLDTKWNPPVDLVGKSYLVADLDGDGFDDILTDDFTYLSDQSKGWRQIANAGLGFKISRDGRYLRTWIDFQGKRQPVLLWSSPNQTPKSGAARLVGNQWVQLPEFAPPLPFSTDADGQLNGAYALDVDCDGGLELVYNFLKVDGTAVRSAFRSTPKGWDPLKDIQTLVPFDPVPHSAALKLADINGDTCKDVVIAYKVGSRSVQQAWLATSKGFQLDSRPLPDTYFYRKTGLNAGQLLAEMGDLRGDGVQFIFWREGQSSAGPKSGAYRIDANEWVSESSYVPPEPLLNSVAERKSAFAAIQLLGKGKTQLAYFKDQGRPSIYSYSSGRWRIDAQLTPPETIAQFDKADLGVRFPDLNGDGFADIAYTKKTSDGKLVKVAYVFQPGSDKPWFPDPRYQFPRPTFSEDLKDTGVFLVDINGDGLTDLLYAYQPADSSKPPVLEAYVNCSLMPECKNSIPVNQEGGYWKSVTDPIFKGRYAGYVPPVPFAREGVGSLGVRAVDINGDGLTDLVVSREEDDPQGIPHLVQRVFLNRIETNAAGQKVGRWVESTGVDVLPPVPFVRPYRKDLGESGSPLSAVRDNRVELIDVDGDRLPDLVYRFRSAVPKRETDEEKQQRIADGRPLPFEEKWIQGAYLNRNGKWIFSPSYTPLHRIDSDDSDAASSAISATQVSFQDVNGDGLPDLIYAERCEGSCSQAVNKTYLNTGAGWIYEKAYDLPVDALMKNTKGDQGYRLLDVNADGLVDVVYHRILTNGTHEKGVYLNSGVGWISKPSQSDADLDAYAPPLPFAEEGRGDLGVRPLDLNGDGIVDLVQIYKRSASETASAIWINEPFAAPDSRPYKTDLLAEVVDGLGRQSSLTYRSYIGIAFDQAGAALKAYFGTKADQQDERSPEYPVLDPPMPGYVATDLKVVGPGVPQRTSSYKYKGYRVDTSTGKSFGFSTQEITDQERKRKTIVKFVQQDGLVGNISSTLVTQELRDGSKVEISRSNSSFSQLRRTGLPIDGGFTPEIVRVKLDRTESTNADLKGAALSSQLDEFTYDDNGNPTKIKTTFADGSGSETTNRYDDNLVDWHLARLTGSSVMQFSPGKPSQTRRAAFSYSPKTGQLVKEASLVGSPSESVIEYERDLFGNKMTSRTSVKTGEAVRSSRVKYDALGRFPISTTNNLGHTSRAEFDEVSGAITKRIDPNGLQQIVRYDSLRRVRQEIDATGVVTATQTDFSGSGELAFTVTKQVGTLPPTVSAHDAAGRPRWQSSTGFEGKAVIVEFGYDALGRLVRSTLPRFKGDQARSTVRRYDELDRQIEERRPDSVVLSTRYEGLKTIAVDPLKRETVIEKDARGRTSLTVDPFKGRTQFEFDASGKATRIVNALGHVSTAEYNLAGQRIALNDPTLGRWIYKYNGFGELVEQTDARGEVVNLKYDGLGRLVERRSKTDVANYEFDQGPSAIGRLVAVKSSQGATRAINYDSYGRVGAVDLQVGTDRSRIEQSYDELSRPLERKYSSGLIVANAYDNSGFWRRVLIAGSAQAKTAWESLNVDALGRVTEERLGNGVVNTQTFDVDSGRLTASSARSATGAAIQDFTLDYDLVGNVLQRADRANKKTERFEYDTLNRITSAAQVMGERVTVSYDPLGNILQKSNTGTYQYCDSERTRTLCGLQDANGAKSSFSYDAAGNMVQLGDKRLAYDSEGRVTSISEGRRNQSSFRYGADGELITQQSRSGETRFEVTYLGDTEIVREAYAPPFNPTPERTRVRHFISAPTGTLGFFETTYWHFPFRHAAPMYSMLVMNNPLRSSEVSTGMTYFVKDQLGSLRATLNERGDVLERFDYDPWGKRRQADQGAYFSVRQGFTGHEHLDNLELVHMGGRVYSPSLARFVSPDPFIQYLGYSQSHNRYSYVLNNPMRLVDPSGYFSLGDIGNALGGLLRGAAGVVGDVLDAVVGKPLSWIGDQLHKVGNWFQQNWRTVAIIAAAVVLGPMAVSAYGLVMGGMISGAAVGALGPILYGGTIDDVLKGAAIGAITGAITGGVAQKFGSSYSFQRVFYEAANGGLGSTLRGQRFEEGFKFAAIVSALSWANSAMRNDQIGKSKGIGKDSLGNEIDNIGEPGQSKGFLGDGYKLGGGRYPEGIDLSKQCGADCTFGGWQAGPGSLGGSSYAAGSWQDSIIESYAGPHDWMREYISRSTLQNGFAASFSGARAAVDSAANAALIVPATYFAVPAAAPAAGYEIHSRCGTELQRCR